MYKKMIAYFLMGAGVLLLLSALLGTKVPDIEMLKKIEGEISSIEYTHHRGGTDLKIYLKNNHDLFILKGITHLPIYDGCRINDINIGNRIIIYYEEGGYSDSIGEPHHGIWQIQKEDKNILISMQEIKKSIQKTSRYYTINGLLALGMGIAMYFTL